MADPDPAGGHGTDAIAVEVVRMLGEGRVRRQRLRLPAGWTVAAALRAFAAEDGRVPSGSPGLPSVPAPADPAAEPAVEGAEPTPLLAVWGRRCTPERPLQDGDRVEWLLPLRVDPKEARRLRHAHQGGLQGGIGRGPVARQRKAQKAGSP